MSYFERLFIIRQRAEHLKAAAMLTYAEVCIMVPLGTTFIHW